MKTINKHWTKRATIDAREKEITAKLKRVFQKLNACKEENSQSSVIDTNIVTTLSFALKNLSIDIINLVFQNKLVETALIFDEKKFLDAFVFSKIKSDEWDVFKYILHVKFQSASTRFAFKKIKLRYVSIKITDLINKVVAYCFHVQKSQIYTRVKDLINDLNVIYNERNSYVKNYAKLTINNFRQFQTEFLTDYINRFNITVAHCHIIEKNKKFWFDKQLNQRLFNRFVNLFEQRILNDLVNIIRNVDWKLSFNSLKEFNNRNTSFTEKINQNTSFIEKIN